MALINKGENVGVASLFTKESSAAGLPEGATFLKPKGFEEELERVAASLNMAEETMFRSQMGTTQNEQM